MDKETKQIRQEEVEYHQQFYQEHELFEEGTGWRNRFLPSWMPFSSFDKNQIYAYWI